MPWRSLLYAAQRLGLSPACFWRLSLREWRAVLTPTLETLSRQSFEALMRRFPD